MKYLKPISWTFLIVVSSLGFGQTFELPDTNFRNKLLSDYPQVMQGDELLIAEANALTGSLNVRYAEISNLSGLEYFTSITTLDFAHNIVDTIADISGIAGLANFYATDNKLTSLPDMSSLTGLVDFQVRQNELTVLPDLPENNLRSIYCSENKLTEFPALDGFSNLINLVIGDNPFDQAFDFSTCLKLEQLHVHKMGLDTIVGLHLLSDLTTLYAWGNQIHDFRGLDSNTALTTFVVFDNPISTMIFIENKPNLQTIQIQNCNLTFKDLTPVFRRGGFEMFYYEPQNEIPFNNVIARLESDYSIAYPVESPADSNVYVWYKSGVIIDSSLSNHLDINSIVSSDAGTYRLTVYNLEMPDLILYSDTFILSLRPCIELPVLDYDVLDADCSGGYSIDLTNTVVEGGTKPFTYQINNKSYNSEVIDSLEAGKYVLTVIDSNGCSVSDDFTLSYIEQCDPVITPDGDGVADTYFMEKPGVVKIYDLKRRLLNTLEAPVVWGGRDQDGMLLDAGYYIIQYDQGDLMYITIIR